MNAQTNTKLDLLKLRNEKGWTQQHTAKTARMSRSYYCLIEKGDRIPSINMAKKLGECFSVDWRDLFASN